MRRDYNEQRTIHKLCRSSLRRDNKVKHYREWHLASKYGVAFFEAMGASLAGHSQMARNLLDKLADKLDVNH
jgi:hypothetical protein